jgi:hypothetical protein
MIPGRGPIYNIRPNIKALSILTSDKNFFHVFNICIVLPLGTPPLPVPVY